MVNVNYLCDIIFLQATRRFDFLEGIVRKYGAGGQWPDMWRSIKRTIHYNGKKHTPELLKKIEELDSNNAKDTNK